MVKVRKKTRQSVVIMLGSITKKIGVIEAPAATPSSVLIVSFTDLFVSIFIPSIAINRHANRGPNNQGRGIPSEINTIANEMQTECLIMLLRIGRTNLEICVLTCEVSSFGLFKKYNFKGSRHYRYSLSLILLQKS